MTIEDQIILREIIVQKANFYSRILETVHSIENHADILNNLRVCRDAIIILNGPISEWFKEQGE